MKKNVHHIDDLFKTAIDAHQEEVPPTAWEAITHELDKKQARSFEKKYYHLRKFAAAVLIIAFLAGAAAMYLFVQKKSTPIEVNNSKPLLPVEMNKENQSTSSNKERKIKDDKQRLEEDKKISTNKKMATPKETHADNREQNTANVTKENSIADVVATKDQRASIKTKEEKNSKQPIESKYERKVYKGKQTMATVNYSTQNKAASIKEKQLDQKRSFIKTEKQKWDNDNYMPGKDVAKQPVTIQDNEQQKITTTDIDKQKTNMIASIYTWGITINPGTIINNNRANAVASQPNSAQKNRSTILHSVSLSAFVSPNLSFNHFEDDRAFPVFSGPVPQRHDVRHEEEPATSFSGGLLISYGLTKNISIQSGITLTSWHSNILSKTIYAKSDNQGHTKYELHCTAGLSYIAPKTGTQPTIGDSTRILYATSKLTYVGIPVSASVSFIKGRFSINPYIGIDINFLKKGYTNSITENNASDKKVTTSINGLKSSYLDGHVGIGLVYELNKHIGLELRPTTKFALTAINEQTPVKLYPNLFSFETGIKIKL